MNRLIKTVLIMTILTFTTLDARNGQNYYKYGDIETKLNKRAIVEIAKHEIRRLVIKKKLPKSWKNTNIVTVKKNKPRNTDDWVVTFNNKKIKNKKRQKLYIFVDVRGNIVGANYTNR